MLEKEFRYYQEHKAELIAQFPNRFIVIANDAVLGDYATQSEALRGALKTHPVGSFLIQECKEGADEMVYHGARVSFT